MISPTPYDVSQHGQFLAIRTFAARIRAAVEEAMPSGPVVLDFLDVHSATDGFVDELVAKLSEAGRDVTVMGSDDLRAQVDRAVARRGCPEVAFK